ncbi:MAG: siroheme synthase CysG [Thalassobaculum sp.]|uniref:siroheme synthase CysG n=1 Tax=Thalassobaculum sp. TaxID=2022740 RepID=UPI0032EEDC82
MREAGTPGSRRPADAGATRLGRLALLPLFVDLDGRAALVAGDGPAAAWKAELLAAAGAEVRVAAPAPGPELTRLLAAGAAAGRLLHLPRPWLPGDLDGTAVAVADAADGDEARRFADAARAAGVPCNVIDRPAFGTFQFGSVVNRSPVVVAIATKGAAPILAQAIRRRIETLLPPSLSDWAALAARMRCAVMDRLAPGAARRAFWEALSERAFGPAPTAHDEAALATFLAPHAAPGGRVTLVGAGPGDPGLLTLNAVRALQSADVVLFDALVSDAVLELARREARRMLVGKRGGRDSCRQEDINDLMVKLARQGRHVVRLKAGDPSVFGRAGEELERLAVEGIPATVVPGITAASAMAASLGVSLTHRDSARAVRFVTGHTRDGNLPDDVDWNRIAEPATTTVFYMGARTAAAIRDRLLAAGMARDTPAVAVGAVSRPDERRWTGPLGELADGVAAMSPGHPVLIGVGDVWRAVRASPDAVVASDERREIA